MALDETYHHETRFRLIEANVSNLKSATELIKLLHWNASPGFVRFIDQRYYKRTDQFLIRHKDLIVKLKPTFQELQEIKSLTRSVVVLDQIIRAFLPKVKSRQELELLLTPEADEPTKIYLKNLDEIRQDFLARNSSIREPKDQTKHVECRLVF